MSYNTISENVMCFRNKLNEASIFFFYKRLCCLCSYTIWGKHNSFISNHFRAPKTTNHFSLGHQVLYTIQNLPFDPSGYFDGNAIYKQSSLYQNQPSKHSNVKEFYHMLNRDSMGM